MSRIIIADGGNIYDTIFADARARVIRFPYPSFRSGTNLHWLFYRITHSKKLRYPFFKAWNRHVVHQYGISKGDTVVILNNAVWSSQWNGGIVDEIKKKGCRVVLLMVDSMCFFENERLERILDAISKVDKVYTFDMEDAKHYGWQHTYSYYSRSNQIKPIGEKSDVFCALWNGGRVEKLIKLYDLLEKSGIKCSFFIHGVSEEDQKKYQRSGIVYNHFISYEEMLGRVAQTNVILELVKKNQRGNTLRVFESVVYNKRLLTDYRFIEEFPFYNNKYMKKFSIVEDVESIDSSFFTSDEPVDYHYNSEFSPKKLFDQIESSIK